MSSEEVRHIEELIPEVKEIGDLKIREGVTRAWIIAWRKGKYDCVEKPRYEYGDVPLYQHIRAVTKICMESADILDEFQGVKLNRDHLIAASLLHDVDKYFTTEVDEKGRKTKDTRFVHGYVQAKLAEDVGLPAEIVHAILIHSRHRFTSDRPQTPEALVLQDADILAMNVLMLLDKLKLHY